MPEDLALAAAFGASAVWAPSIDAIYPDEEAATRYVAPPSLRAHLCGPARPGHFDGVVTVVARLLALVNPDQLWLGEKDWQQLVILRHLVDALGLPVTVRSVATVREADGLALSSRNRYLSESQRAQAGSACGVAWC